MKAREIVARARWYERYEDASPAEALLSVLIDLFTEEDVERFSTDSVQRAWQRLSRDRSLADCLQQHQVLTAGVDVLAGNLVEAGCRDLAVTLRQVAHPRIRGAARREDVDGPRPRRLKDVPEQQGDGRLLLPYGAALLGLGR